MKKHAKIKVGITMGDPAGIGPAIIALAWPRIRHLAECTVIGDAWVLEELPGLRPDTAGMGLIDCGHARYRRFEFGKIQAACGRQAISYLDRAFGLLQGGKFDCLVTCPISKQAIALAGYPYSGHTEYFSAKTHRRTDMMLLNKDLRFVLVTRHIALRDVSRHISQHAIVQSTVQAHAYLRKFFAIGSPRLVVCSLNPHASDHGLMGDEEDRVIIPAVKRLKRSLRSIEGPLPCDVAIAKAQQKKYDCVIAMYHDQALIPLKFAGLSSGVNVTLGMPFVRTSPLHGTAFDIALTPRAADPGGLVEAVKLAIRCTLNQRKT